MIPIYDLTTIILAGGSAFYLFTASLVLWRRGVRERAVRWLILYISILCLWQLSHVLQRLRWPVSVPDYAWERILAYGLLFLSSIFLFLARSFLLFKQLGRSWWGFGLVWVTALVVLDVNPFALPETLWAHSAWDIQRQGLVSALFVVGWMFLMGGSALLAILAYRRTEQPLHKNRITYWLLPLALTLISDACFFAGQAMLGALLRPLAALSAAFAVLSHRLPDIRQTTRRAVAYIIVLSFGILVYTAGFAAIQYALQDAPGYSPLSIGAAMALLLIIFFNPFLNLVQRVINRLIYGLGYDAGHTLREYSVSISNILDLDRLANVSLGLIGEAMGVQRSALLLTYRGKGEHGEDVFHLRDVRGLQAELAGPGTLRVDSPLADVLWREHRPLLQYDVDLLPRFQKASLSERNWFTRQGMDVYVPISAKGEWIGLLAMGPKASGDRYFDDDLALLCTLADQTAVALENARLVDDLRQAYDDLDQANRRLRELDELKSAFIGVVTHELRTPFSNIDFSLQLLDRYGLEQLLPEQREQMGVLTTGVKEARTMVDNLVTFATFISKQGELNLDWFDFREVVQDTLATLGTVAEVKGITLHPELPQEMPQMRGDRNRLADAVHHLVQNGIKFNEEGGKVWLRCSVKGGSVTFEVEDTGVGVPAEKLPALWDAFTQMADPLRRGVEGLGLGLALVKYVASAHGGVVRAESEEGVGSTFGFSVPLDGPKRLSISALSGEGNPGVEGRS